MITFCTKFPPDGQSVFFSKDDNSLSVEEKGILEETHKSEESSCYLAIGVDEDRQRLLISSLSASCGIDYSEVERVYLQPTLPAKGQGMLEIRLHKKAQSYPDGILWSSKHTDNLQMWLRDIAINISELLGVEFQQLPENYDC